MRPLIPRRARSTLLAAATAIPLLGMIAPLRAASPVGPATIVAPDRATQFVKLESSFEGVRLTLSDPETGELLRTAEDLYHHGWTVTTDGMLRSRMDGFYETTPLFNEMGRPIRFEVSGLYPGRHEVAVQYFSQPFAFGSTWSYRGYARLSGQRGNATLDHTSGRLIAGTGGADKRSRYDLVLGESGSDDEPVSELAVTLGKKKWSKQISIAGIRIRTAPSIDATLTTMDAPAQSRVREVLASLGPSGEAGAPAYHAAALPSAVKVKPKSFLGVEPDWLSASADLAAARNEHESFQILLYHPTRRLADVTWSVEEIEGPSGASAEAIDVAVMPVGYIKQPRDPHTVEHYGYVPDPLLTFMDSISVEPGEAQTLWVRLSVPADAEPGVYRGAITLRPDGMPAHRVPFTLEVWDVELPPMPFLPVVTGVGKQAEFEMGYGINPTSIYSTPRVFQDKTREASLDILRSWKERGVSAINLKYITYKRKPAPSDAELKAVVDEVEGYYELTREAGMADAAYVYLFDEANPADYPAMRKVAGAIKQRMPDLRLVTTAYWGEDRDFGTEAEIPIDTWVPIVQHFRDVDLAEKGKALGRNVWWYTANYPRSPMPNVLHDNAAMETRMLMGVMPHAFRVEGYLYYATTRWRGRAPITDGPYTDWSIQRPYGHGGWYQKTTGKQPLPSIRMEVFRDGLEDYDLIELAKRARAAATGSAPGSAVSATVKLLDQLSDVPNPYVASVLEYNRDPLELEALRRRLAELITTLRGH